MIDIFSDVELVHGDVKKFNFSSEVWRGSFGWATVECIDITPVIARSKGILNECIAMKAEQKLDFFFFTAVNIVDEHSILFVCGSLEKEIAEQTFESQVGENGLMDLGNLVSRKKQFIPPTMSILQSYKPSEKALQESRASIISLENTKLVWNPAAGFDGQIVREKVDTLREKVSNLGFVLQRFMKKSAKTIKTKLDTNSGDGYE